jgi:hypothetical protein
VASGGAGLGITGVITGGVRLVVVTVGLGTVAVYIAVCRAKKLPAAPIVMPIISMKMAILVVQDFGRWGNSAKERIRETSVSQ